MENFNAVLKRIQAATKKEKERREASVKKNKPVIETSATVQEMAGFEDDDIEGLKSELSKKDAIAVKKSLKEFDESLRILIKKHRLVDYWFGSVHLSPSGRYYIRYGSENLSRKYRWIQVKDHLPNHKAQDHFHERS